MFRIRYLLASIVVGILWGIGTIFTGGYYDAITWSCWMVSNLAVVVMFLNYLMFVEKVMNGTANIDFIAFQSFLR